MSSGCLFRVFMYSVGISAFEWVLMWEKCTHVIVELGMSVGPADLRTDFVFLALGLVVWSSGCLLFI